MIMTHTIDDELLVAYADGELDDDETRRVEARLAADPAARKFVRELRESAQMLRAACNRPMLVPVPERLYRAVDEALAENRRREAWLARLAAGSRHLRTGWQPAAIAASLLFLAVGLGGGFFVADYRMNEGIRRIEASRQEERKVIETAVAQALERQVSGTQVRWAAPGGSHGAVTPIRTFRTVEGQWCREYKEIVETGGSVETRRGIACRNPEGEWKTRLQVPDGES
jgi:anti-sigma factor RsiW